MHFVVKAWKLVHIYFLICSLILEMEALWEKQHIFKMANKDGGYEQSYIYSNNSSAGVLYVAGPRQFLVVEV